MTSNLEREKILEAEPYLKKIVRKELGSTQVGSGTGVVIGVGSRQRGDSEDQQELIMRNNPHQKIPKAKVTDMKDSKWRPDVAAPFDEEMLKGEEIQKICDIKHTERLREILRQHGASLGGDDEGGGGHEGTEEEKEPTDIEQQESPEARERAKKKKKKLLESLGELEQEQEVTAQTPQKEELKLPEGFKREHVGPLNDEEVFQLRESFLEKLRTTERKGFHIGQLRKVLTAEQILQVFEPMIDRDIVAIVDDPGVQGGRRIILSGAEVEMPKSPEVTEVEQEAEKWAPRSERGRETTPEEKVQRIYLQYSSSISGLGESGLKELEAAIPNDARLTDKYKKQLLFEIGKRRDELATKEDTERHISPEAYKKILQWKDPELEEDEEKKKPEEEYPEVKSEIKEALVKTRELQDQLFKKWTVAKSADEQNFYISELINLAEQEGDLVKEEKIRRDDITIKYPDEASREEAGKKLREALRTRFIGPKPEVEIPETKQVEKFTPKQIRKPYAKPLPQMSQESYRRLMGYVPSIPEETEVSEQYPFPLDEFKALIRGSQTEQDLEGNMYAAAKELSPDKFEELFHFLRQNKPKYIIPSYVLQEARKRGIY